METVTTMEQERLMLALVLDQGILAIFSHHNYSFNGEVRFQEEGGPIGLEVSGAVGKVVMLAWCKHPSIQAQVPGSGGCQRQEGDTSIQTQDFSKWIIWICSFKKLDFLK